jgi:hypothetical protein
MDKFHCFIPHAPIKYEGKQNKKQNSVSTLPFGVSPLFYLLSELRLIGQDNIMELNYLQLGRD